MMFLLSLIAFWSAAFTSKNISNPDFSFYFYYTAAREKITKGGLVWSHHVDVETLSCFEVFDVYSFSGKLSSLKPFKGEKEVVYCQFNLDPYKVMITNGLKRVEKLRDVLNMTGFCQLDSNMICDGSSQCLSDECGCGGNTHVFFCLDGSGCVTFDSLCDNSQDCPDGSDERFCEGFVQIICTKFYKEPLFLSTENACQNINQFESHECSGDYLNGCSATSDYTSTPLYLCLQYHLYDFYSNMFELQNGPNHYIKTFCKNNCTSENFTAGNWKSFCDSVGLRIDDHYSLTFNCTEKNSQRLLHLSKLCDGIQDCKSGVDEVGCPDRFYCSPGSAEWIMDDKICDHFKDCSNGRDECGTCEFGALSSSQFLIHSKPILGVTTAMGLAIIVLNFVEGRKCFRSEKTSKIGKIDRIFRLQIFFYDFLMGVYLCSIVLAAIVLHTKAEYCLIERSWRQSPFCPALGIVFSLSSHGSLLSVAMTSVTRWMTCSSMDNTVHETDIIVGSILAAILNIAHAALPLLPIPEIQDIFRTEIFFTNLDENPFFKNNPINMSHLSTMYAAAEGDGRTSANTQTMLKMLENTTTKPEIFQAEEISYYGNTGLCVHNIFKLQASYSVYKWIYCAAITLMLATVSYTYVRIVMEEKKSRAAVGQAERDPQNSLALKVVLMIGSQLLCWFPFILTTGVLHYLNSAPPPLVHEIFTLVVIPVNSFLNPAFYSSIYQNVMSGLWKLWRKFVDSVLSGGQSTEQSESNLKMSAALADKE